MKKYVGNLGELNEEERRTGKISYARLIERISDNLILCNNIVNIDENLFGNIVLGEIYNEETEEETEIYQYFIIDIDDYTIETLQEAKCNDLIIAYSETLENYILMVDHLGTAWSYVMTDIEYTTNYEEADI